MIIDCVAKQTHRRGVLAALAGLLILPATTRAQHLRCAPRGAGCTLLVGCCGNVECVRVDPLNPNSGVCGSIVRDSTAGPVFISPTTGSGSAPSGNRYLTREELLAKYDANGDGELNCLEDFGGDHALAQAAYDDNPTDPFRLDQGGEPGLACEELL